MRSLAVHAERGVAVTAGFGHRAFVWDLDTRKQSLVLYIMDGFKGRAALLKKLGPHKTGKACLYVKRLEQVDLGVLEEIMAASYAAKGDE